MVLISSIRSGPKRLLLAKAVNYSQAAVGEKNAIGEQYEGRPLLFLFVPRSNDVTRRFNGFSDKRTSSERAEEETKTKPRICLESSDVS